MNLVERLLDLDEKGYGPRTGSVGAEAAAEIARLESALAGEKNLTLSLAADIARLRASLPAAEDARDEWKDAVEDELVVCGILNESHKDPRKAVKDAIAWNVRVALDPLVSEVARDAQRYRWLKERTVDTGLSRWMKSHIFLDCAIDAAMSQDSGKEGGE